jgi:DNA/RNA endonuclease G, NUC1
MKKSRITTRQNGLQRRHVLRIYFDRKRIEFITIALLLAVVTIPALIPSSKALTNGGIITSFGSPLTENFDSLAQTGTNITWTNNVTIPGWYSSRTTYNTGTGSSNTGALYSFGLTPASDRALGSVGSGGTGTVYWAVRFINNTGGTITSLNVNYIGEQWRTGGSSNATPSVAQTVDFQYQVANAGVITGANTPTTGWVDNDPLDFTSPNFNTTTGAAIDGNNAANRVSKSGTIALTVANGQEVWLRWVDIDHPNNDHGMAIDDLSVTANGSGATNPTGVGNANPNSVPSGGSSLLTVTVTPGASPISSDITVNGDLTPIGGSASQQFFDDATHGDVTAGDNVFSFDATVDVGTAGGLKTLATTVSDAQSRSSSANISLTVIAPTPPSGTGAASPNPVQFGGNSLLTVTVTPGTNPTSSGLAVTGDLTAIGGSANQQFFDDGSNGDVTAGNNVFSFNAGVPANTTPGAKSLPIQISDAQSRTATTSITLNVQAPPPPAGSLVISQVYAGGGNTGATFKNDFIEIINHTGTTISLDGLSVQYASAAQANWQATPLGGSLAPGQYYLIKEAAGTGGTVDLPTPDATGGIAMGATAGKVAIVSSVVALTNDCPSDSSAVIDFVGYGATASCFEGSGPTTAPSNTTSVLRKSNGCTDTDDNNDDFDSGAPSPRNTSTPINNCAVLSGVGSASPPSVQPGDSSLLTVNVTPGSNPTSTGLAVVVDLSSIGGSASQSFTGNGNLFSFPATVNIATSPGQRSLPVTITDDQSRTASTTINLTVLQPPPSANHIVISQLYGGGGNASATYKNDFVELYNPGTDTFDLTGWSLQYASVNGSGWGSNKQPLGGTITPGQYYLIKLAGGTTGADLPQANVEGGINLSGSTGKVALVSSFQALSGPCPLSDPNLVDFVGYGSSASTANFCFEGTLPATGPNGNNTQSVLRKNGGNTDTNNNGNDFLVGAANPRRTAPIVELGPNVLTTDPASNGFNIPHDASMTVTFTEPVDVIGAWYDITCSDASTHNDATVVVSNSNKTYVITPNVNFPFGGQCTVTIKQNAVHDQDTDDSGPNTDTMSADYSWTFSVVGAGAPAPYPPSVHLTFGNPSGATNSVLNFNNYLMEKPTYTLSYNRDKGTPNWVSWHLEPQWFGSLARFDTFRPDPAVPPDWYRVQSTDYSGSGFDRGHMTPNADRDNENRIPINQETYLMSNMVPQAPDNNQGPWASFENYLRSIVSSPNNNEVYIVSGPLGTGGSGSGGGTTTTIAGGHVTVPAFTWKVVLVIPIGDNDISRVTAATRTIAILMPNVQGIRNNPWENYLTTVDDIEGRTGYDFFSELPDEIENAIEAGTNGNNFPGTAGQSVTTAEDNSTNITLTAASPGAPLTYSIVTPPAHGQLTGSDANRTYAPDPKYNGPDSFTFKVNDGSHDSNTSTVTISVTEVNDAPTANNDTAATDEDTQVNISALDLTTNDSAGPANESSQTLTVTTVSSTVDTHGSVVLNSGIVTYTPEANYHGPASFSYQVCDNGTTNGALDSQCASATVNITVNSVNDNPVAVDDSATTDEDTPVTVDVVANDTDVDGDTRTLQSVGTASHGSVTIVAGQAHYSPAANFNGSDSFTYVVSDGHGGTATGTVNITVNSVNDSPVAVNDSGTTNEDTPITINVVANDTDVDGDARTLQSVGTAAHGSVTIVSGQAKYAPATDFNGNDSFTYVVSDGHGGTATGTVNITVSAVNDAPALTGVPTTASVVYSTNLSFTAQATDVDLPAQTLTFSLIGAPSGATINPTTGVFSWTPTAAQAGNDGTTYNFSVAVSDGDVSTLSPISAQVLLKSLTSLGPAQVWLGVASGGDAGTKVDLLAEVFRNGASIGSGQLNDVSVGAVSFNSVLQQTIGLTQVPSTGFRTGDILSVRLSVRIAASSPNKNGTVRLWFNDAAANTSFGATIGGVANSYYLRSGFVLTTSPGSGPRTSLDVTVKRTGGSPFTPFGTWTTTY